MDALVNDEEGDALYDSTGAANRGWSRESRESRMSTAGGGGTMLSGDVIQVDMGVLADVLGENYYCVCCCCRGSPVMQENGMLVGIWCLCSCCMLGANSGLS